MSELVRELFVGPGGSARAHLAEQDRVLECAEYHRERELGSALGIRVPDRGAVCEQQRGQTGPDVLRETLAARLELGIDTHALRERAQEAALLAVDLDEETNDSRRDLGDARALPSHRVERRVGG